MPKRSRTVSYYLEGVDRGSYDRARAKLRAEGRTLAWLLRTALEDYADGAWRPRRGDLESGMPAPQGGERR